MQVSLIIPMYNEGARLPQTLSLLDLFLKTYFEGKEVEVLFVDDGSKDGCADLVRNYGHPAFSVLSYNENKGKGYAVRYGMQNAKGAVRIFTDCDLAYGTDAIYEMYSRMCQSGKGMAIASRRLHEKGYGEYSPLRRLMSATYYRLLRCLCGIRVSDSQCGLKGFTGEAAEQIFSLCEANRFAFDVEVILLAQALGIAIDEMPAAVLFSEESSVSAAEPLRMLREALSIRKRVKRKMKRK